MTEMQSLMQELNDKMTSFEYTMLTQSVLDSFQVSSYMLFGLTPCIEKAESAVSARHQSRRAKV